MKRNSANTQSSARIANSNASGRRGRSLTVVLGLVVCAGAVALIILHHFRQNTAPASSTADNAVEETSQPVAAANNPEQEVRNQPRAEIAHPSATQATPAPALTPAAPALQPSLVPASPRAQEFVARIVQAGADPKTLTAEGAAEWRQNLKSLAAEGESVIPAIRDFLTKNQDVLFTAAPGQTPPMIASLRAGLFDVLGDIGGTAALQLMTDVLRSTSIPTDIAALAGELERLAPGQFRQEVVDSARRALDQVSLGQAGVQDAGPLFQVLQNYGDANVAADLAAAAAKWPYYATVALAQMPAGNGIPALIQQLQNSDPASETRALSYRMLAQMAAQYPDAATALLDQARQNQISDRTWRQVVAGLSGDQFMLNLDPSLAAQPLSQLPGFKTYHMQQGNQNYFSLPVGENGLAAQRLDLIGQLLGATSNPAAIAALQSARDTLSHRQ
jgi:hypothetical protein